MDAYRVLWDYYDKDTIDHHEMFTILLLNTKNDVLGIAEISEGGITSTIVDNRIIFQLVLTAHAVGIILCHNHPSGNPTPSESDVEITKKLIEEGRMMNIAVLDHLVICGDGSYYSLADEGRIVGFPEVGPIKIRV
jgi:DNA repair protein RadC